MSKFICINDLVINPQLIANAERFIRWDRERGNVIHVVLSQPGKPLELEGEEAEAVWTWLTASPRCDRLAIKNQPPLETDLETNAVGLIRLN